MVTGAYFTYHPSRADEKSPCAELLRLHRADADGARAGGDRSRLGDAGTARAVSGDDGHSSE